MSKSLVILIAIFLCLYGVAQPSLDKLNNKTQARLLATDKPGFRMRLMQERPSQANILFEADKIPAANAKNWLAEQLQFRKDVDVLKVKNTEENSGVSVEKLQQYYKGIKVEHGIISVSGKAGLAAMMQAEFYSIPDNLKTNASLSENAALKKAMEHIGASKYVWEGYTGNDPELQIPKGELVIMEDRKKPGVMCLCYKFIIEAEEPVSAAKVYINAQDGSVVLVDNLICTANATGIAETRYSGIQSIVTNRVTNRHYELDMTTSYGVQITTLNYKKRNADVGNNDGLASPFIDANNDWDSYHNANYDDAALDAHFNMQVVADFWFEKFGRKGFDNKVDENNNYTGAPLVSYVHVQSLKSQAGYLDNAYFSHMTRKMYYGDGAEQDNPDNQKPFTSLDIGAHEFGHGVCFSTAELVYAWESGALNEGFSDIWGTCVEKYFNDKFPSAIQKSYWLMGEAVNGTSARNLQDPKNATNPDPLAPKQPDTYKNAPLWKDASYDGCPFPEQDGPFKNDACGVHTNSGVLNKWFYLLVSGGVGTNSNGTPYALGGIGFEDAMQIAFRTEQNLTPNAGYAAACATSEGVAIMMFEAGSPQAEAVRKAWIAVGVSKDPIIFNTTNTGVFSTNEFTSICVGKDHHVWAGTSLQGLYKYDGTTWAKAPVLTNHDINQITSDKDGGIWIAQGGHDGNKAVAGGVDYFPTSSFGSNIPYRSNGEDGNLPSRYTRGIFVDLKAAGSTPKVWTATIPDYNATIVNDEVVFVYKHGGVGLGLNSSPPPFTRITDGLHPSAIGPNTFVTKTIGGNDVEVWAFDDANPAAFHIVRYNSSGTAIGDYNSGNTGGKIPEGVIVTAIHFDNQNNKWVGLASGGIAVLDYNGVWHKILIHEVVRELYPAVGTLPAVLMPEEVRVNFNAITSDKFGNIYIGTDYGLILYKGANEWDKPEVYKLYTTAHGLPSNNIMGITLDNNQYSQTRPVIATDNGIMFMGPICRQCSKEVHLLPTAFASTVSEGNWNNGAIWSSGTVPDSTTEVVVRHNITINANGECLSFKVLPGFSVHVNPGVHFLIKNEAAEVIETRK